MQTRCSADEPLLSFGRPDVEEDFKAAMRRHASGVAILTTVEGGRWYGMTATAVMSLSMEPPSLAIGVNRSASIHNPLLLQRTFCVNLLRSAQAGMCDAFSRLPSEDRFTVGDWMVDDIHGLPCLAGAQVHIFCNLESATPVGSHSLVVGTVIETRIDGAIDPLLYIDGSFATRGRV